MIKKFFFLLIISHLGLSINAQNDPITKGLNNINPNVLQSQLGFLSSDWMEGRRAGEKGEALASDYIASMLQLYGVKPFGDNVPALIATKGRSKNGKSYFQNFALLKIVPGTKNELSLNIKEGEFSKKTDFTYKVDFDLLPFYSSAEIQAPVVFAGYGFRSEKLKFNDLNKLDVKGKFILIISGVPAFATGKLSRAEITSAQQDFESFVKSEGAAGIVEVNPGNPSNSEPQTEAFGNMSPAEYMPRPSDNATYMLPEQKNSSEMIRIGVTFETANEILKGTGNNIQEYIRKADTNSPYILNSVSGRTLTFKSDVATSLVNVRNVLGIIEGNKTDEILVIGAHYDHMGMNAGYIWNGADDNGSGTVGVMTIAKAIMETGVKPEKTIIIALWTAEEMGLIGSEYFMANAGNFRNNIKLNFNFDMISRYISDDQPNNAVMTYTDKYSIFRQITEDNLKKYVPGLVLDFQPSDNPPGGTDHRTFVKAGIPIMRIKPGHRKEYHTPADEVSTIDWDIMEKILKISFADIWTLANSEW